MKMRQWFVISWVIGASTLMAQFPEQGNVDEHGKREVKEGIGKETSIQDLEALFKKAQQLKGQEGVLKFGEVDIDPQQRQVSFPVTVNMTEGMVEYALVTEKGKVHESVFSTKVKPSEIQVAMLLLNTEPEDRVGFSFEWQDKGLKKLNLSEVIAQGEGSEVPLAADQWIFLGSIIDTKGFTADREGSIISLIFDQTVICTHMITAGDVDQPCFIIAGKLPKVVTTGRLVIQL